MVRSGSGRGSAVFLSLGRSLHEPETKFPEDIAVLFLVWFEGDLALHTGWLSESEKEVCVRPRGMKHNVYLRLKSSDIRAFNQVFLRGEHGEFHLLNSPEVIIDAGANIGLATFFFRQ